MNKFNFISNRIILFYCFILAICQVSGYFDLITNCGLTASIFALCFLFIIVGIVWRKYILKELVLESQIIADSEAFKWNIAYLPVSLFWVGLLIHYLTSLPVDYDGNAYHLPLAFKFLQSDSFSHVPKIWHYAMPSNAEALFYFFGNFRSPVLLNFIQIPLLIAFVAVMHDHNRYFLKLSTNASAISISCVLMMPFVFQGVFSHYVDFFGTVFLYFSICVLLQTTRKSIDCYTGNFIFAGLLYGVSVGTKLTFIVYAPLVLAVLGFIIFHGRREGLSRFELYKLVLFFCLSIPILSSFWYLRNYVLWGNPLYPLSVPLFGWTGVNIDTIVTAAHETNFVSMSPWGWLLYPFTEQHPAGVYHFNYGPVFAVLVLPAVLVFFATVWQSFHRATNKRILFSLIMASGSLALWYLYISRQPRFFAIAVFFAVPVVGYIYDLQQVKKRQFIWCYAGVFFLTTFLAGYDLVFTKAVQWKTKHILNWASSYSLPIYDKEITDSCIINMGMDSENLSLYGPDFENRVYTNQEVRNFYFDGMPSYDTKTPIFQEDKLLSLHKASKCNYIYSKTSLPYQSLELVRTGKDMFPDRKWLDNYLYRFK